MMNRCTMLVIGTLTLALVLATACAPAPTAVPVPPTPVPPTATAVPPTAIPKPTAVPPTATSIPTGTPLPTFTSLPSPTRVPPSATPVPPTSTPQPTKAPLPSPTSEFPAGMGALSSTNFIGGLDVTLTVNGKTYVVPNADKKPNNKVVIFLPPGKYVFSANIPLRAHLRCELFNGCSVEIKVGQYTYLDWS